MADIVETVVPATTTKFLNGPFGNGGHGYHTSYTDALANLKDVTNEDIRNLKDVTNADFRDLRNVLGGAIAATEGARHSADGNFAQMRVEQAKDAGGTRLSVAEHAAGTNEVVKDLSRDTLQQILNGFKDGRYDAATLTASIIAGQVAGFKDARYDSSQSEGRLTVEATKNASAVALAFKDAAILALQNKADSDAKLAACCCELKEKIDECCCELKERIKDGDETTRDLISNNERDRLRDQVDRLTDEITYLKGRLVPGTPV